MDSLTFIGTATTLLRLGPFTLLTDPCFVGRGRWVHLGYGRFSRRLTDPWCGPEALPELDAVVLSHLHGDHFDGIARRGLSRRAPVLTTPAAAGPLRRWGFHAVGLDTWEESVLDRSGARLTVRALPARHARGVAGALLPPVMGSLLTLETAGRAPLRVYVSGDTVLGPHLEQVARRHPDIDVAVLHLGGTRVLLHQASLDGEDGVGLLRLLRPTQAIPVHHDDFGVFRSPLSDFVDRARRAGLAEVVTVAQRGQTVPLHRAAPGQVRGAG